MSNSVSRTFSLVVAIVLLISYGHAQIRLPRLISSNAVFQRDKDLRLFGYASPGENVKVTLDQAEYSTVTGNDGVWQIVLPPQPARGPHKLKFSGTNELLLTDILFGDVWICSGQSNMELTMERVADRYEKEIASSADPMIRYFDVQDSYNFKGPAKDVSGGEWLQANPETVKRFSAVAYFFSREIRMRHRVPIGLINASLGGSPAEAWLSETALREFPVHHEEALRFRDDNLINEIENADRLRINDWYRTVASREKIKISNINDEEILWQKINIPGLLKTANTPPNGTFWFKRSFNVTHEQAGTNSILYMGRIIDQDSVFINGKFAGTTSYQYPPRRYPLGEGMLHEGENTIVVKLISQSGSGGFVEDKPYMIKAGADTISLAGEWNVVRDVITSPLGSQTFIRWKPLGLYNGMISPLQNFSVTGVIWYQGEANTSRASEYSKLFPALINDWKAGWRQEFPFLFVQLPNFMKAHPVPTESQWAELRESQRLSTSVPQTGMAVAIDVGEWNDIHPFTKDIVGRRLALHARKMVYEEDTLTASSPSPSKWKFEKKRVVIDFKDAGKRLVCESGTVRELAISADGRHFEWASSQIDGNRLIVWSDKIDKPVAVRYAWADNPSGANLYGSQGLPATPFQLKK